MDGFKELHYQNEHVRVVMHGALMESVENVNVKQIYENHVDEWEERVEALRRTVLDEKDGQEGPSREEMERDYEYAKRC